MASDDGERARGATHTLTLAAACAAPLVLVGAALLLRPSATGMGTHRQLGLPPCALEYFTSIPCPGCGVTTTVTLVAHGRPAEGLANQPFGVLVAALLALAPVWAIAGHRSGRHLGAELHALAGGRWGKLALAIAAVSWLYKIARVHFL